MITAAYTLLIIAVLCWWYIEEQLQQRLWCHLLNATSVALLFTIHYLLPASRTQVHEFTFVAAYLLLFRWLYAAGLEISDRYRAHRQRARRAAMPLQEPLCTTSTIPCHLSIKELYARLREQFTISTEKKDVEFTAMLAEVAECYEVWAKPLPAGGWVLVVSDYNNDDILCDKELEFICCKLGNVLSPRDITPPCDITALGICHEGRLYISPASCAELIEQLDIINVPPESPDSPSENG